VSSSVPVVEPSFPFAREYELAVATAREAGALLRSKFGNVRDVRYKGLVDPVTEADAASEALIATRLLSAFPNDRLLAEEGSAAGANAQSERVWIVDPLDGTTNFMHGYPVFCVSIGLHVAGQPQVGVVYDPMRDELFAAACGQGATLNASPLAVSDTRELLRAMLATGFAYDPQRRLENIPYFEHFTELTQAVRRDGAAALDIASVAAGRFDGYWERGVSVWDVAAATLILTEAGGSVSAYDGGPYDPYSREIVSSNTHLHPAMLAAIADVSVTRPRQAVDYA
jgi:myo-inositol-1(or 4)-monophosphatase